VDEPKKNSVLIVDDDNINIMILTHILNPDYTVYAVKNGTAAIRAAEKHLPDVILLDIMMPKMNGYAVLAELKKSEKTNAIPVIFITVLSYDDHEEKGLALGAADYITKPFYAEIVKLRVRNQIRLTEQFRAVEHVIMKHKLVSDALGIALWDLTIVDGNIDHPDTKVEFSQEFRQILGFNDENDFPNILDSWRNRLHPEEKEAMRQTIRDHIYDHTGKTPYNAEYRLMAKNGEYRYFHGFGTTQRDSAGVPLRMAGALRDIDKKKKMQDQHKIMSSIAHNSPSFISYKEFGGKCLYVNPAASQITGYTHEELIDDYLGKIFGEKALEYVSAAHKELLEKGATEYEYNGKLKDGTVKTFAGTSFLIGKNAFATIASDVTEARKHENMMQAVNKAATLLLTVSDSNNFETSLLTSMEIIGRSMDADRVQLWQLETKDGITNFVHTRCWLSEIGKQKAPMPIGLLLPYGSKPEWEEKFKRGKCINGPVSKMQLDDQVFFSEFDIKSIILAPLYLNEQFWGLFSIDDCVRERSFTEDEIKILRSVSLMMVNAINRRAMMNEIENSLFETKEANRYKSEFLSRMSHEMLTPMNAIMGMTQIAKMKKITGDQKDFFEEIGNASRHLLRLINDLLDLSGKKDGAFKLAQLPFSFETMFKSILKETAPNIVEKHQTFNYNIDSSIPALLIGDEKRLSQVVTYLLMNASKFTPDHGKIILSACVHSEDDEMIVLQISVADTGIGIEKEKQSHIFNIFEQVDGSYTRKYNGTGLGLPVAKRIIEMMDGHIWVESEPDKGAKFIFTCKMLKS
jgi:PAS domain S-box-containing protein